MNNKLHLIGAALLALSCGAANALAISTVQSNPGLTTTKSSVCTVSFDTIASLSNCPNATYSANTPSQIVSGSLANQYLQPTNDATPFLAIGGGDFAAPVTITLTVGANYFGFYAGSIDGYNAISFTGSSGTAALSGDQINAVLAAGNMANGSQGGYFNVFTDALFTSITLSSTQAAFETDNHSFGIASPVPEPESIALMGIGLFALVAAKRRRAK